MKKNNGEKDFATYVDCFKDLKEMDWSNAQYRDGNLYLMEYSEDWTAGGKAIYKYSGCNGNKKVIYSVPENLEYSRIKDFEIFADDNYAVIMISKNIFDRYFIIINQKDAKATEFDLNPESGIFPQTLYKKATDDKIGTFEGLRIKLEGWDSDSAGVWVGGVLERLSETAGSEGIYFTRIGVADLRPLSYVIHSDYKYTLGNEFNIKRKEVIFEKLDQVDNLSLVVYNIFSKEEKPIVVYPRNIYYKYFSYPGQHFYGGCCGSNFDTRKLNPKWRDDNAVSYTDLETRKQVTVKIN